MFFVVYIYFSYILGGVIFRYEIVLPHGYITKDQTVLRLVMAIVAITAMFTLSILEVGNTKDKC